MTQAPTNGKERASGSRFLTTEEVADLLRTSPGTVRYWACTGRGPRSIKVGRRRLYAVTDVEAFIAQSGDPAA